MELGKQVRHYSGEEGIDELWGEPFKAFITPLKQFYESRYIKIAMTMHDIEVIGEKMVKTLAPRPGWSGVKELVEELTNAAKQEAEIMRRDEENFHIWPRFVAARERMLGFAEAAAADEQDSGRRAADALSVAREGTMLTSYLAGARVPMPRSLAEFIARCDALAHPATDRRITAAM